MIGHDEVRVRLLRGQQGPARPAGRQGREPGRDEQPGLPVPPGFTITTDACRAYLEQGSEPEGLADEVGEHLAALEQGMGRTLGQPDGPLLVSVRSGAKFSMPGMMETVLNVGLNDESVQGLAAMAGGDERFAWDSYRRLLQMFGTTVLGIDGECLRRGPRRAQAGAGRRARRRPRRRRPPGAGRDVQGRRSRSAPARRSRRTPRAAGPGGPRGLRLLEHRAGGDLPAPGAHPRRPRHRRQHRQHGVRQLRRRLRHRRRVHPRPRVGSAGRLRRLPAERAGRGRRRRHPQHGPARGPGAARQGVVRRAARHHAEARGRTTATCATSSSPSSGASSGCCRPGSASAPRRRPSGSPPSSSTRA